MRLNCKIKKAAASRFADRVAVFFIFVLPSRAAAFCVSKGNDSVLRKDRKKVFTHFASQKDFYSFEKDYKTILRPFAAKRPRRKA